MRVAEKWDGRMPGVGVGGGDWKQRARRAEAEAAAARAAAVVARSSSPTPASVQHERELRRDRPRASAGGSPSRCGALNALRRRLRGRAVRRASRSERAAGRRPWRPTDCVAARSPAALAQPRQALGDRERARVEQAPQRPPPGAPARSLRLRRPRRAGTCDDARCRTRLASSRSSSGLRSHGSSDLGDRVGPRARPRAQTTPRPKKAGTTASRRPSRPATKSSIAVSTPLRGPPSRAAAER